MRSFVIALVIAVVVLGSAVARADEPAPEKDPSTAVLLSVGVTTAGVVAALALDGDGRLLGLGAMWLGPSTGRWYAGDPGLGGIGLRALAAGAMVYGLVDVLDSECDPEDGPCSDVHGDKGGALLLAGAGLWVGSTIADVVFAEHAARDWNARIAVSPSRFPSAGGGSATGLVLRGSF